MLVVVFAVANRSFVPLDLWPFAIEIQIPVFLLVLGSLLFGFLIGALVLGLSMGKLRRKSRAARGEITKLERQAPAAPPAVRQRDDSDLTVA